MDLSPSRGLFVQPTTSLPFDHSDVSCAWAQIQHYGSVQLYSWHSSSMQHAAIAAIAMYPCETMNQLLIKDRYLPDEGIHWPLDQPSVAKMDTSGPLRTTLPCPPASGQCPALTLPA